MAVADLVVIGDDEENPFNRICIPLTIILIATSKINVEDI